MSISMLMNRPCTITHRSQGAEKDRYGNEIMAEEEVQTVCEIQETTRSLGGRESEREGDMTDATWMAYFPADTVIGSADTVSSEGLVLEVSGEPWYARNPRSRSISHVEVPLRRTAGPEEAP